MFIESKWVFQLETFLRIIYLHKTYVYRLQLFCHARAVMKPTRYITNIQKLYLDRVPATNASGCTAAEDLLYKPWSTVVLPCSARCLHLIVKGRTTWTRNGRWISPENARLLRNIQGSFTCRKSTTWDKRLYFPFEGRRAEDFFALKNPTASTGFEPANLGTKGQHATSRPPKPQHKI